MRTAPNPAARLTSSTRAGSPHTFNLFHVPNEIAWGRVRRWQKRDDVYQVGPIAVMLLRGDIKQPMRSKDVRLLPCSDQSKPRKATDILVRGQPNAQQIAGKDAGSKLIKIRRLAAL